MTRRFDRVVLLFFLVLINDVRDAVQRVTNTTGMHLGTVNSTMNIHLEICVRSFRTNPKKEYEIASRQ